MLPLYSSWSIEAAGHARECQCSIYQSTAGRGNDMLLGRQKRWEPWPPATATQRMPNTGGDCGADAEK